MSNYYLDRLTESVNDLVSSNSLQMKANTILLEEEQIALKYYYEEDQLNVKENGE